MAAKKLSANELELVTAVSDLETSMKRALQRISDLKLYEDSGSAEEEELAAIHLAGEMMRKRVEDSDGKLPAIMRDHILGIGDGAPASKPSRRAIREMTERLERDLSLAEELHKTLDKREEKLKKYNLPKRIFAGPTGLDDHLEKVRDYMAVSWRESAESLRAREYKSLADWTAVLAKSEDADRRATSHSLKGFLVDLGAKISHFLVDYFVLALGSLGRGEITERLGEVEAIIKGLSVEDDWNSVVIERFVTLVGFVRRAMMVSRRAERDENEIKDGSILEKENDLFHLIAVEILRLEVSFGSPDLPMMLLNEVYFSMGRHLVDNVFEDKLVRIAAKIDEMKKSTSGEKDYVTNFFEQVLYLGIKDVWDGLDLDSKVQD